MTLRQLFYRVVSAGVLPNSDAAYRRLGRLVGILREAGTIPMTWIVDHIRQTLKPSSWSGLADFGDVVRDSYRLDYWSRLPVCVEILVEKDSVSGALQEVTERFDVALRPCRGFASTSFASCIAAEWRRIEKPIFVYYVGDFDPSGFDIERNLREKLERYSGRWIVDRLESDRYPDGSKPGITWTRLGVVESDFDAHDLVPLPPKRSDTRYKQFVAEHGGRCAEVEGIPPNELRRRVETAILSHVDADEWAKLQAIEKIERATVDSYLANWGER